MFQVLILSNQYTKYTVTSRLRVKTALFRNRTVYISYVKRYSCVTKQATYSNYDDVVNNDDIVKRRHNIGTCFHPSVSHLRRSPPE